MTNTADDANIIRWCLLEGRKIMREADRRDSLRLFMDGAFEDFEEMDRWLGPEPLWFVSYDDLALAGQRRLETAANMRAYAAQHGSKWRPAALMKWLDRADEIESGCVDDEDRRRWVEAGSPVVPLEPEAPRSNP